MCARVYININKMSGRDHENWTTKFDCICYQNFSLKTKFFLDFLFIDYISWIYTIDNTHVIHVLNFIQILCIPNTGKRYISSSFSKWLPNIGKCYSFLENVPVNAETNRT